MNFMTATMDIDINQIPDNHYLVVHPLDDQPEEKIDTSNLGPMPMTTSTATTNMVMGCRAVCQLATFRLRRDVKTWRSYPPASTEHSVQTRSVTARRLKRSRGGHWR